METLAAIGTVTYGVLLVILGFSALIIVHEWGHFIAARLNGVRCEKFYIGFDFWGLKLFKVKWGDTEYGLGLFPFGGYLKMLGQEDNPGAIQAEIEKAKLQETTPAPPQEGNNEVGGHKPPALEVFAPDSYLSKTVPQRLAIIVAGVVMNFLFAIVCAAAAYLIGVKEAVPAIGNVIPGSPAWEAGLQPGDKITAIDGKPSRAFGDVMRKMIEGTKNVELSIDRQGKAMTFNVSPRKREGDHHPYIGIGSLPGLELAPVKVPKHWEKYFDDVTLKMLNNIKEDDSIRLDTMDGETIGSYIEYQEAQLKKIGQPITCFFRRVGADAKAMPMQIPAIPMREIPLRFKMGASVCVQSDSDAYEKGIREGDTIVSVDGDADFDPLKLPQILLRKVNEEKESVDVVVKKAGGTVEPLTLKLKPTRFMSELGGLPTRRDPLASNALGLAWNVEPVIAAVKEYETPSGQPVPAVGDRVVEVEWVNCPSLLPKASFIERKSTELSREKGFFILDDKVTYEKGLVFQDVGDKVNIPYLFSHLLQVVRPLKPQTYTFYFRNITEETADEMSGGLTPPDARPRIVRLTLDSPDKTTKIVDMPVVESTDWFNTERGYVLQTESNTFQATGLGDALYRGTVETIRCSFLIYNSLYALINGTVSTRALHGPVGIVEIIYRVALMDLSTYLMLLCLIGANLAVINLLPIPPLDGGHVLFLSYEGIFRRPPNELIQVILSYVGLFLILLLMVWTVALDVTCIPRL
jgi:regulator of sigma E protease